MKIKYSAGFIRIYPYTPAPMQNRVLTVEKNTYLLEKQYEQHFYEQSNIPDF
jgi:hypothetical protein